jgi:hypothetical protein
LRQGGKRKAGKQGTTPKTPTGVQPSRSREKSSTSLDGIVKQAERNTFTGNSCEPRKSQKPIQSFTIEADDLLRDYSHEQRYGSLGPAATRVFLAATGKTLGH